MVSNIRNIFMFIFIFIFISGCTFSSKQYSEWIGSKSFKKFEDLNKNMWTLKTNDNSYELLAVSVSPEKSIFADRDGRYILFNGWTIIEKGGFINIDDKVLISNEEGFVLVKENGKVKYRYKCKNWDKNNEGENKIFTQNCIGRYNVINKIVVNKSGFIEEISQGITNTNKPWILSKN